MFPIESCRLRLSAASHLKIWLRHDFLTGQNAQLSRDMNSSNYWRRRNVPELLCLISRPQPRFVVCIFLMFFGTPLICATPLSVINHIKYVLNKLSDLRNLLSIFLASKSTSFSKSRPICMLLFRVAAQPPRIWNSAKQQPVILNFPACSCRLHSLTGCHKAHSQPPTQTRAAVD